MVSPGDPGYAYKLVPDTEVSRESFIQGVNLNTKNTIQHRFPCVINAFALNNGLKGLSDI